MRIIDYTSRGYGHDFTISTVSADKQLISGMLWNKGGLDIGDYLILPQSKDGKLTTRYRVVNCEWLRDPTDMYRYEAIFDPRT
jgi:hypothetical protein